MIFLSTICSNLLYAAAVTNDNSETKEKLLQISNPKTKTTYANPNSAATGNYGNEWQGKELQHEPIIATCTNESKMSSIKTKELIIEVLPKEVKKSHELPTMTKNLLSVPLLYDEDCVCVFCKDKVFVIKNSEKVTKYLKAEAPILTGLRDYSTNLWDIPVETTAVKSSPAQEMTIAGDQNDNACKVKIQHTANSAYQQRSTVELQAFHHLTLSAPRVSTLTKAFKSDFFSTFLGFTFKGVRRHLSKLIVT